MWQQPVTRWFRRLIEHGRFIEHGRLIRRFRRLIEH
jgi:hypothetical protein